MSDLCTADAPWCAIERLIGSLIDLEASADRTAAFRQARGVPSAAVLLRLCLAYALSGSSLRRTCAWAMAQGLAELSNPALEKRLQRAGAWLGEIAGALLAARAELPSRWAGYQFHLVDATALSVPGATGTSWRLHLSFDLGTARMVEAYLTDVHGGEQLGRFVPPPSGCVTIADAGYPHPRRMRAHLATGGDILVRTSWNAARLLTPEEGTPFDLFAALRDFDGTAGEWTVRVDDRQPHQPALLLRLIAGRKPPQACEQARRRVRENARRKGKTADARSLAAADWVLVLTSLPAGTFPPDAVLAAYRLRWQIELAIKRWKSLLGLGQVPVHSPQTAVTWIYAALINALLIEDKVAAAATHFPPRQPAEAPWLFSVANVRALGPELEPRSPRPVPVGVPGPDKPTSRPSHHRSPKATTKTDRDHSSSVH